MGIRLGKDLGRFRTILCQRLVAVFYDSPHDFHFLLREASGLTHLYVRLFRSQHLRDTTPGEGAAVRRGVVPPLSGAPGVSGSVKLEAPSMRHPWAREGASH